MDLTPFDTLHRKPRGVIAARILPVVALLATAYFAVTQFLSASSIPVPRVLASSSSSAELVATAMTATLAPEQPKSQMTGEPATSRVSDAIAGSVPTSPPTLESPAQAPVPASQPIQVLVDAPAHIANGSTFEVSVGVPSGRGIYAARFSVRYDDDALEVLDITDATGASVPGMTPERGSVELDLNAGRGARQAPAIRFLTRTSALREIRVTVAASLSDRDGIELPVAPIPARSIVVDP